MPVAVTGASGFIGSAVVRKLLERGRHVRAVLEPGANTRNLDSLGGPLERVTADVCSYDAMRRALDGCDTLYHLAAVYRTWLPDPSVIYRVNIDGTTSTLLAARDAQLSKIVYTSSIAAIGLRADGALSDESLGFNYYRDANDYILSKYLSERVALQFAASGQPIVIVNPAFPFGPGDIAPTPTGRVIVAVLRREIPALGPGGFCVIDVDDVAEGHLAAETKGVVGERYVLGNHNVSLNDFIKRVGAIAGVKTPRVSMPKPVACAIALGLELYADHVSHREPPATYRSIRYAQNYLYYDNTKARTSLGLPTRPLDETIERSVQWFRSSGMA